MTDVFVCDDNNDILESVCSRAYDILKEKSYGYRIASFHDYDSRFKSLIKQPNAPRVYILDIETPSNDRVDIIRKIRECDRQSEIIIITAHEEYEYEIIRLMFSVLVVISKLRDDFLNQVEKALETALVTVRERTMKYTYTSEDSTINIPCDDILFVSTVKNERKVQIVTSYTAFYVKESLSSVVAKLDRSIVQTHLSCYVNINNVIHVDYKNNIIYFNNKIRTHLLSRNYKKNLKERLKSI